LKTEAASLGEYIVARRGEATVWLCRAYADPAFVDLLAGADDWFADPRLVLVKDTKKTKVGRLTVTIAGASRSIYVKRYNAFSLRYRMGSLFSRSAARRSLCGAQILAAAAIASAQPVASVEARRCGMLRRSFFISEEIAGARTTDAFWRQQLRARGGREGFRLRRAYLARLAALFAALHARRIYHDDLKDANIMALPGADGSVKFALLDLEGVRRCARLSERRRVKNLMQLYRTLGRQLTRSQKLFLLKSYLGAAFRDRALRRRFATAVIELARRVDRRKAGEAGRGRRWPSFRPLWMSGRDRSGAGKR
jgi:hypothetical protein